MEETGTTFPFIHPVFDADAWEASAAMSEGAGTSDSAAQEGSLGLADVAMSGNHDPDSGAWEPADGDMSGNQDQEMSPTGPADGAMSGILEPVVFQVALQPKNPGSVDLADVAMLDNHVQDVSVVDKHAGRRLDTSD